MILLLMAMSQVFCFKGMDYEIPEQLRRSMFGKDFKWGVSTAAFQTEGAYDAEGKGRSVWDVFTERKGKILNAHHAKIACDFYNRYPEDIALVKKLNIPNLRFSVSWPRLLPSGKGNINQKGIDYYNRIIDSCLQHEIDPWLTLYHWDLPHDLELKGGWTNRDIISWFSDYAALCAKHYGDRIKNWIVMNEPMVFTGAGYFLGLHAPGRTGLKNFLPAVHHSILSMSAAGRILKETLPHASVGTTFSCSHIEPYSNNLKDIAAAGRADVLFNRMLIEPVLGMGYPETDLPVLKKIRKYFRPEDEGKLPFDFDFIGIQNYTREVVKYSFFTPYLKASLVKAKDRKVTMTSMGWEVYPEAIYHMIKKYNSYPRIKKIYITENGAAFPDKLVNGKVNDSERINFIRENLKQVLRAKNEGFNADGYFVWTITDNFEWAEGYHPRFGLVHIDFDTQKRTVKLSGSWYAQFLNEFKLHEF